MGSTKRDHEEEAILHSMEESCLHYVDRNKLDITNFIYLGSGQGEFEIVCTHCGEIGSLRCYLQAIPNWGGQVRSRDWNSPYFSKRHPLKERS